MPLGNSFYKNNRRKLGEKLDGGLIVLAAYDVLQSSADMTHEFDFEANFFYLTGLRTARWRMVYDGLRDYCYLVRPELSDVEKTFNGYLDDAEALEISGADKVVTSAEFEGLLRQQTKKHNLVYTLQPEAPSGHVVMNPAEKNLFGLLGRIFTKVSDCRGELAKMRALKQPEEIVLMKKAAQITMDAFQFARAQMENYRYEYEIEADFTANFRRRNARHAYEPIVAGGNNAVTLHYIENKDKLAKRNLILLDIGARYGGYASDITRTFAFGQPTKRQTAVHQAVRAAQAQIIGLLAPGLDVMTYQKEVDRIMLDACRSLDLGDDSDTGVVRRYMPHAVSHGLGIDTHDSLGRPRELREGMVLTVEPGIYLAEEGVGVRIEDDILITASGHDNLTAALATDL